MSRHSRDFLCYGLGALTVAPFVAHIGIWIFERHLAREGLREWMRR